MTAITTLVGVITVSFAVYEHHSKERAEEIAHWQRVLVYKIIAGRNGLRFSELKVHYVTASTQLQAFTLPSKEIQDDAMRYILLDLQRDKLIYLGVGDVYRAYIELPNPGRDQMESVVKAEFERQQTARIARPAILRLLERESGRYTVDELFQRCRDEHITIENDDLFNLIAELRTQRIINRDPNGKLYTTFDIEPDSTETPQPQPSSKPKRK
jgi:hypothetical protein